MLSPRFLSASPNPLADEACATQISPQKSSAEDIRPAGTGTLLKNHAWHYRHAGQLPAGILRETHGEDMSRLCDGRTGELSAGKADKPPHAAFTDNEGGLSGRHHLPPAVPIRF